MDPVIHNAISSKINWFLYDIGNIGLITKKLTKMFKICDETT